MTQIRPVGPAFQPKFGSAAAKEVEYFNEGFLTRNLYGAAEFMMRAPKRIEDYMDSYLFKTATPKEVLPLWQKAANGAVKSAKWFFSKLVDYDYREFPMLGKLKISEPPIGALILLLFPFTIGPRLYRAAKRDSREVGDVLRRDVTAITIFLFALKPLINVLNRVAEKFWKIDLVDKETGKVFKYEQMGRNYLIDSDKTLMALIKKNQEVALQKAAEKLSDNGLAKASGGTHTALQDAIDAFNHKLKELIPLVKENKPTAEKVAQEAFAELAKMDSLRTSFISAAKEGATDKLVGLAEKLPKFNEFLVRYAKTRRLPIDIGAFLAVCVGIGWFPVWFNDQWNKKQFAAKMAEKRAIDAANFDPTITFQALKQSSRLNQSFLQ